MIEKEGWLLELEEIERQRFEQPELEKIIPTNSPFSLNDVQDYFTNSRYSKDWRVNDAKLYKTLKALREVQHFAKLPGYPAYPQMKIEKVESEPVVKKEKVKLVTQIKNSAANLTALFNLTNIKKYFIFNYGRPNNVS
jgi:hypothetical protein